MEGVVDGVSGHLSGCRERPKIFYADEERLVGDFGGWLRMGQ